MKIKNLKNMTKISHLVLYIWSSISLFLIGTFTLVTTYLDIKNHITLFFDGITMALYILECLIIFFTFGISLIYWYKLKFANKSQSNKEEPENEIYSENT